MFADPYALIDAAAQVLGELPVNVTIDCCTRPIGVDHGARRERRRDRCCAPSCGAQRASEASVEAASRARTSGRIDVLPARHWLAPAAPITQTISQKPELRASNAAAGAAMRIAFGDGSTYNIAGSASAAYPNGATKTST